MTNGVRATRERRGLTQAQLAERAGVSRQLVGAVEAGRHEPGVGAALAISAALGVSAEELFGAGPSGDADAVPAPDGPVRVVRIGDRRVALPVTPALAPDAWALADGTVRSGRLDMLPGGDDRGLAVAGCDPSLGLAAGLLARRRGPGLVAVHATSGEAVGLLAAGRVHGVLVHGPASQLPEPPVAVQRWRAAGWQVGLAGRPRRPVPDVASICERRTRVVQRAPGASAQAAFERAVRAVGAPVPPPGPVVGGHLDAARLVAAGAHAGVTMEAGAHAFGLPFRPLEEHTVQLWVDVRWLDHAGVAPLVELLGDRAFTDRLRLVGGYDLSGAGDPVAVS